MKNNEYKDKIKEINIILNEKENEINYLNNELKQIKQINKEKRFDYFKNNYIDKNVLEVETKELLKKQGIEIEEINKNNINQIIKQLLINNEQKTYDNIELKSKIVILNSSIKQIKKDNEEKYNIMEKEKKNSLINYYSEKIDFLEKENNKLRNINNKNFEKSNKISEERNKIKRNLTELKKVKLEKDELSNQIYSLKENNKKLNEINSQLIMKNKDIESKYETEVKKYEESKLSKLSNHSMKIENIRLKSSINFNERLLNNEINLMINDLELFNKFQKESKEFEKIIENDIQFLTGHNYEISLKKAKNKKNKFIELMNNMNNVKINDKENFTSNNVTESIEKLNEIIKLYKANFINAYNFLITAFNKVIELYHINKILRDGKLRCSLIKIRNNQEKDIKNKIFEIIFNNIEKFKPICYSNDNSDLKEELNNLKNISETLTSIEILKKSTEILEKIIERSVEYRFYKDKVIKNLNYKITYLLNELENYEKYYNSHKKTDLDEEKRFLNNQLFLQDGEIIRLNQENDKLLKEIEYLIIKNDEINLEHNE